MHKEENKRRATCKQSNKNQKIIDTRNNFFFAREMEKEKSDKDTN